MSGKFEDAAQALGAMVDQKNAAYGDSFAHSGEVLRLLFPSGVRPDQYSDLLGIARVVDKLFRLATKPDAFGETPWADIAGYGILGMVRVQDRDAERAGLPRTERDTPSKAAEATELMDRLIEGLLEGSAAQRTACSWVVAPTCEGCRVCS